MKDETPFRHAHTKIGTRGWHERYQHLEKCRPFCRIESVFLGLSTMITARQLKPPKLIYSILSTANIFIIQSLIYLTSYDEYNGEAVSTIPLLYSHSFQK